MKSEFESILATSIYCTRCGHNNEDSSLEKCSKCSAVLAMNYPGYAGAWLFVSLITPHTKTQSQCNFCRIATRRFLYTIGSKHGNNYFVVMRVCGECLANMRQELPA
jgi:hypothetical protein